ncbi:hypothetical protein Sru01_43040 [Sphaerisporangium rufum]|uniref:Uncharacterized protein n=1 Tax=Sphaerisporangium rufum TaxID=1381558 RepID=A0A919R433_9ACTN|nr:hypothetical protein Sru01_43040 [Sphaerisporangium rufum]
MAEHQYSACPIRKKTFPTVGGSAGFFRAGRPMAALGGTEPATDVPRAESAAEPLAVAVGVARAVTLGDADGVLVALALAELRCGPSPALGVKLLAFLSRSGVHQSMTFCRSSSFCASGNRETPAGGALAAAAGPGVTDTSAFAAARAAQNNSAIRFAGAGISTLP